MTAIQTRTLPDEALLARYRDGRSYTDCYSVDVAHVVSHAAYVEAFYTSAVFKVERQLLAWLCGGAGGEPAHGRSQDGIRVSRAAGVSPDLLSRVAACGGLQPAKVRLNPA